MAANGRNGKKKDDELKMSPEMEALLDQASGMGLEDVRPEDLGQPFFTMVQKGSPVASRGDDNYIPGAAEGMWLDFITRAVYDTLTVLPVKYVPQYIEWNPRERGGGFVKNHGSNRDLYDKFNTGEWRTTTPQGNEIVTTHAWFTLVIEGAIGKDEHIPIKNHGVFNFSSTAMNKSRQWINKLQAMQIAQGKNGKLAPIFLNAWNLSAKPTKNQKGSWMLPEFKLVGSIVDLYPNDFATMLQDGIAYHGTATRQSTMLSYPKEVRQLPTPDEDDKRPARETGDAREDESIPF